MSQANDKNGVPSVTQKPSGDKWCTTFDSWVVTYCTLRKSLRSLLPHSSSIICTVLNFTTSQAFIKNIFSIKKNTRAIFEACNSYTSSMDGGMAHSTHGVQPRFHLSVNISLRNANRANTDVSHFCFRFSINCCTLK